AGRGAGWQDRDVRRGSTSVRARNATGGRAIRPGYGARNDSTPTAPRTGIAIGLRTGLAIATVPATPPTPTPACARGRAPLDWPAGTKVATIKAISGGDKTSVT